MLFRSAIVGAAVQFNRSPDYVEWRTCDGFDVCSPVYITYRSQDAKPGEPVCVGGAGAP